MGLVLSRKVGEVVVIRVPANRAEYVEIDVEVTRGGVNGGPVKLHFTAPDGVDIRREEVA